MKNIIHIILTTVLLTATTTCIFAQNDSVRQRITLHNTTASIIPPKHFEYDSLTEKISHPGSLATIQMKEIKGRNFKKITSAMTEKYFAAQGFELLDSKTTIIQDGNEAVIFRCRFRSHDNDGRELDFIRLMLFTGDENTIWVTADFPECMDKLIEAPITNSIMSISKKIF